MVKNVNSVVYCSISQKAHLQTSEIHWGHLYVPGAYREQIWAGGGEDRPKKPPLFLSQQRQKLQKTRLLKELKADTAAVWFPWHVFWGEWQRAEEMKVRLSPRQRQPTDALTSFGWHRAVPSPSHGQGREAGSAHQSREDQKCASAPTASLRPPPSYGEVMLRTEPIHQLAPAKKGRTAPGTCLAAPC